MPKFQALNYLTEALKKRHALLERMLLLPPQHLEHVDNYIHKGDVPDCSYLTPWKSADFDWFNGRSGEELIQGGNDSALCNDVFGGLSVDESSLEFYDVTDGLGNGGGSSGVVDDSMSVEIELAMEKVGIGMCYTTEEEFNLELLDTWNNVVLMEDGADWLLEEVESTRPLATLLDDVPTVDRLCSRLKPKMIQDPLQGNHHPSHSNVFRCDRHMIGEDVMDQTNKLVYKEQFNKDELLSTDHIDEENDKLVGLFEEPDVPEPCNDVILDLPQLDPSPCSDHEAVLASDLASMLTSGEENKLLSISPTPVLGFVDLNNQLCSETDSDSGVNLLESPCVVAETLATPTFEVLQQLHRLEPLPLSPDWNTTTTVMSSKEKERVIQEMWQQQKMFDELLALILQVPDVSNGLTLEPVYAMTVRMVDPFHVPLDTNMELEMGWDPLYGSHDLIVATQSSLCQLLRCPIVDSYQWSYQERFSIESSVLSFIVDDVDDQFSITSVPGGGVALQQYDLPRPRKASSLGSLAINASSSSSTSKPSMASKKQFISSNHLLSSLDEFISMRTASNNSSSLKPLSQQFQECGEVNEMEYDYDSGSIATGPQTIQMTLSEQYLPVLEHIEKSLMCVLNSLHLIQPLFSYSLLNLTVNHAKQFTHQQQVASLDRDVDNAQQQELYRLALQLLIYCSVVDLLLHCSPAASISELMNLLEQHSSTIGRDLDPLRHLMARLQVNLKERGSVHPKMVELRNIMCRWVTKCDRSRKKAIIVLDREFCSLSGEILDTFQSIRGLSACVHSWMSGVDVASKHQDTIEDRFCYYDCLLVPRNSLTGHFPWHRVNLLVEYEQSTDAVQLRPTMLSLEHVVLKCVSDVFPGLTGSPVEFIDQDEQGCIGNDQYLFIGSETLTHNAELLRLLETKHNITILERDCSAIPSRGKQCLATADVVVDTTTGIILQPVSVLEETSGLKDIVNLTYNLSTQYELLWIILYSTPTDGYPYAGSVSINMSRLHASLALFDVAKDEFQTRVVHVSTYTDVADMIRSIGELAHRSDKVWGNHAWIDRSWLNTDSVSKHEAFLLSLPCINAFSAQVMLAVCSLKDLLTMSPHDLTAAIPWVPSKVLKMFHLMINLCKYSDNSITEYSDDTEHAAVTAPVITCDDDDEFVRDSLSETDHSPNSHDNSFYLSSFFQDAGSKTDVNSPLFVTAHATSSGLNQDDYSNDNIATYPQFDVIRNGPRGKMPLKAIDLDSTDNNHFLQANDRCLVRAITPSRVISGYANRKDTQMYDYDQFNCPRKFQNMDVDFSACTPSSYGYGHEL